MRRMNSRASQWTNDCGFLHPRSTSTSQNILTLIAIVALLGFTMLSKTNVSPDRFPDSDIAEPPAIVPQEMKILKSPPTCKSPNSSAVDCRDGEVFATVLRYLFQNFTDIRFYRFGKPVPGDSENTCDVAWRFRPKEGKRAHGIIYKDYRRFKMRRSLMGFCSYAVIDVGDWHSGTNARKKGLRKEPESPSATGEAINGSFPVVKSQNSFSSGRYLLYDRGGDYCKNMNQFLWSFLCALGEAQYLERTFVMDLEVCISGSYSPDFVDRKGKDFRLYYDFEHLKEGASVADLGQFWIGWNKWRKRDSLTLKTVDDFRVSPKLLKRDQSTLIQRVFPNPEPDNFWYNVCEGKAKNLFERPWNLIRKSKRLLEIVSAISTRLNWDFDSVRIVRGEKARDKQKWPNLDSDTSPDSVLQKLRPKITEGRDVYIATDELDTGFFDSLRSSYRIHFLNDFSDLWGVGSDWYNESLSVSNGKPVEFDGYMRVEVDTEVFYRAKTQIETFGYLTKDCEAGVGTCT